MLEEKKRGKAFKILQKVETGLPTLVLSERIKHRKRPRAKQQAIKGRQAITPGEDRGNKSFW